MAEQSAYWNTTDVGDGPAAGYTPARIRAWLSKVFNRGATDRVILAGMGNELAVTGAASPLQVATGAAICDGFFYENTAPVNLTVTTPVVGTTGGSVILRVSYAAQTVRLAVKLNTDGNANYPSLTNTPGVTVEYRLYNFRIATNGTISLLARSPALIDNVTRLASLYALAALMMDGPGVLGNPGSATAAGQKIATAADGIFRRSGTSLGIGELIEAMIAAGGVELAALGDDSVDDTKVGNRVPQFYRRQGGHATDWQPAGTTGYTPGAVRMIGGSLQINTSTFGETFTISIPAGVFSAKPLVLTTVVPPTGSDTRAYHIHASAASATQIDGKAWNDLGATLATINWLAIGPGA